MKKLFLIPTLFVLTGIFCHASLVVMSFNVRQGNADDGENGWEYRKAAVPAMIYDVNADVFGVQEAHKYQIDYIEANCPRYKCVGVGRDDGAGKGEHMSVFYNVETLELLDWGNYWLSQTPEVVSRGWDAKYPRTATWALLKEKATGRQFFFVNTHLDHKGVVARREGLALLHRKISKMNPGNFPMILIGDFNVTPDDAALADIDKIMESARNTAVKSDAAASFNGWGKSAKIIDYIYYSGFDVCTEFCVNTRTYAGKSFISDHYPIVACLADRSEACTAASIRRK